jgi:hypothetical protein
MTVPAELKGAKGDMLAARIEITYQYSAGLQASPP